jgi:hypothetical protein
VGTARGASLGNPRLHEARKNAVETVKVEADRYAANVLPIIRETEGRCEHTEADS